MHVERTWFVDNIRKDMVFRMTAHIDGRQVAAEIRQGGHGRDTPRPPQFIDHTLRKQIMGAIEQELFRD